MPPRNRPRNRRAVVRPNPNPSLPGPASTLLPANSQAGTSQEIFDLGNVSGSDDSDEPARGDCGDVVGDLGVNDPDAILDKSKELAPDIIYFYDRSGARVVCRECRKVQEADPVNFKIFFQYSHTTSNTSLRPHIERHHLDLYLRLAKERGWTISLPGLKSQSRTASDAAALQMAPLVEFSDESFHQHLLNFIIADDQALNVVECPEFRQLLHVLRSDLDIPHRTKIHELLLQAWRAHFHILRRDLEAAMGQVSFTLDIWTGSNSRHYLAITAHWIAAAKGTSTLYLKAALIAFHQLRKNHSGRELAETVMCLLDRAGVTVKVGHFTMDNASNNKTMMQSLKGPLGIRDIGFDPVDRRIMCFAHVVNLCSGRVIHAASDGADYDDTSPLTGDDIVATNPIAVARAAVRVIRETGERRIAFNDTIKSGNEKGWFKKEGSSEPVQLRELQLLRDVRTRWDSVYYMLNRLREMRPAIDLFLALPKFSDLAKYRISSENWKAMQDIELVLSVPHAIQHVMSNESTPILCGTIPAFEVFMTRWEKAAKMYPNLKRYIEPGLEWAYMYYDRMDLTGAYVIAMLLNPAIRMTWVHEHWELEYIAWAEATIHATMTHYRKNITDKEPTIPGIPVNPGEYRAAPSYMSLAAQYGLGDTMTPGNSNNNKQTLDQEYQAYVTAPCSPSNFEPLKFWEINRLTLPTLFAMAMDYLPVQASSVPCERVFSSSAETDTKRRNRMNAATMEALQMLKFHLKKARLDFMKGWVTSDGEMLSDEPDEDLLAKLLTDEGQLHDVLDKIIQCDQQAKAAAEPVDDTNL